MRKSGADVWSKWRQLVAAQARSGQSVAAFCRERGLCAPHFFVWKKRLHQTETGQFVQVEVVGAAPARPVAGLPGRGIEVRLAGGRSLWVEPGFDAEHLRAVLAVLEARP